MKQFVISQGPILERQWNGIDQSKVIHSTWFGEDLKKVSSIRNFLLNHKPIEPGPCNLNYQKASTLEGLKAAQRMGATHAVKCRSDFQITNPEKFLSLTDDTVKFIGWHHHEVYPECPGYSMDFVMSGPIDDLINLWTFGDDYFCSVPEIILTQRVIDLDLKVSYYWKDLSKENDLIWLKNNQSMNALKSITPRETYSKDKYSNSLEFLNNGYLRFLNL